MKTVQLSLALMIFAALATFASPHSAFALEIARVWERKHDGSWEELSAEKLEKVQQDGTYSSPTLASKHITILIKFDGEGAACLHESQGIRRVNEWNRYTIHEYDEHDARGKGKLLWEKQSLNDGSAVHLFWQPKAGRYYRIEAEPCAHWLQGVQLITISTRPRVLEDKASE